MTGRSKKRRLGAWIGLAVVLLCAIAPLVWRYRPLNQTERALLGTWKPDEFSRTANPADRITLTADRRFVWRMDDSGTAIRVPFTYGCWSASNEGLFFKLDSPKPTSVADRIRNVVTRVFDQGATIRFDVAPAPDGNLRISDTSFWASNSWVPDAPGS